MAGRSRRSLGRDNLISKGKAAVAQPFRLSKKELKKNLTDEEKEEVKKFEIRGEQFTYRLRSIRQILNEMNDDTDINQKDGSSAKKRRRSSLKRGRRHSIVSSTSSKKASPIKESNKELSIQTQELQNGKSDESMPIDKQETHVVEVKREENYDTTSDTINCKSDQIISNEEREVCANSTEEQDEEMIEKRQKALAVLERLRTEQEDWVKLLLKHEYELSEAIRISNDPSSSSDDGSEYLSEEQRQFLENRIQPDDFLDQLQKQGSEFCEIIDQVQNSVTKMKDFKERVAFYLNTQTEHLLSEERSRVKDIATPRRLITNIIQSAAE